MLDVYVKPGQSNNVSNAFHHLLDRFSVIVDRLFEAEGTSLQLTNYKRISEIASRESESGQICNSLSYHDETSLCICDSRNHKYTFSKGDMLKQLSQKQFGMTPLLINVHGTCLFLVIRHYRHSAAFEAANVCEGRLYEFTLHFHTKGMLLSGDRNIKVTLGEMQETFVGVAVQASYHKQDVYAWYSATISYSDVTK